MYVHIGNNIILNKNDIIAIFDINVLKESRNNLRINNIIKARKLQNDSSVIIKKNGEEIITNISVSTLKKRLDKANIF